MPKHRSPSSLRNRGRSPRAHVEAVKYANRYGWVCHWCGKPLTVDTITADHLTPASQGGSDHEPNIVPACEPCNQKRGNKRAYA